MNEIAKWGGILFLLTALLAGCQSSPTPTVSATVGVTASVTLTISPTTSATPTTSPQLPWRALPGTSRPIATSVPGGRIAFVRNKDIYVINVQDNDAGESNLTNHPAWDIAPSWSPDGSQIVFASDRDRGAGDYHIYAINSDGSGMTQLTRGPGSYILPLWSPDGNKIVYASAYPSDECVGIDIYVMNSDGSEQVELGISKSLCDAIKAPYIWSPDGSQLAFAQGSDVYVIDCTGLEAIQLADMPDGLLEDFAWSPDGTQIAFTFFDGQELADVYLVNRDGSTLTNLTANPDVHEYRSAWSPDGKQITFARWDIDESNNGIWITNVRDALQGTDSSGMYRLTEKLGWLLAWLPDGSKIIFDDGKAIYIVNADGSELIQLTTGKYPVWSP